MTLIGLTGTTGAGKGALTRIFEKYGIPTLETDAVSHIVYQKGHTCYDEIVGHFGNKILGTDGEIDRQALANIVFLSENRAEELKVLSTIAHRHILEYADRWVDEKKASGHTAAVIDAPQLFESGYDKKCDQTVAVLADTDIRIKRIIERDGISLKLAQKRIEAQKNDKFFVENCDIVLYNNTTEEELEKTALPYIKQILKDNI